MCEPPLFFYMLFAYFCSDGSAFAVDFAILRSRFWYRQTVPKMGP